MTYWSDEDFERSGIGNPEAYAAATKRRIINNAQTTFMRTYDRAQEVVDAIGAGRVYSQDGHYVASYADNFIGAMAQAFDTYGKLTPKQVEAVLRGIDSRAERLEQWRAKQAEIDATSEHVGVVGKRVDLTLVFERKVWLEPSAESQFGGKYLVIARTTDGNIIKYMGNSNCMVLETIQRDGWVDVGADLQRGDTFTVKATIKSHDVYKGAKQTSITRPKAVAAAK